MASTDNLAATKYIRKDTAPPQKSITRGSAPNVPVGKKSLFTAPKANPKPAAKPAAAKLSRTMDRSNAKKVNMSNKSARLPSGTMTTALSVKNKPNLVQNRLKKKSPWFTSISDPLHGADCKIPDETGVETGTFQLVERHLVTTNSQGITGFRVACPYMNSVPMSWASTPVIDTIGANFQRMDPAATTVGAWGGQSPNGTWEQDKAEAFEGVDEFTQFIDVARIVSAALYVQPEPSLSDNKGEYTIAAVPFMLAEHEGGSVDAQDYDEYANLYKSVSIPLNKNQPGCVRWYPFVREEMSFKAFYPPSSTSWRNYDGNLVADAVPTWELAFVTHGCAADVGFRVTVVINYEFAPKFNSMNFIDASPSPNDATETDLVENWVQDLSVATVVPSKVVESSPSGVSPQHGETDEGTGFGMFFNVIKELAPLALALL